MVRLTQTEFNLMNNHEILFTKREVQSKLYQLLALTKIKIKESIGAKIPEFSLNMWPSGKISKGENYKSLPYLMLDYPCSFSKQDIFAFRTMFYWGNFFSITLHLQGRYLDINRESLVGILPQLIKDELYISNGSAPWHYHYEPNNYILLSDSAHNKIRSDSFIKISKKINLAEYKNLPEIAALFITGLLVELNFDR